MEEPTTAQKPQPSNGGSETTKTDPAILWSRILSIYLVVMVVILGALFYCYWDLRFTNNMVEKSTLESITLDSLSINNSNVPVPHSIDALPKGALKYSVEEEVLITLAIIVGAFGALLHAIVSIGVFAGNRSFEDEWSIWYFFRPIVGGLLALIVYFIVRAGFIGGIQGNSGIYTVLAISGLAGMFSKQALEKLSELFDVIFQSKKSEGYRGKLVANNPAPTIVSINPDSVEAGPDDASITVTGTGFIKTSVVRVNQLPVTTEYASSTELKAIISDLDQYKTDSLRVRVFNGTPGGGLSEPVTIKLVKTAAPAQSGTEPAG